MPPISVLVKSASSACNLRCAYCFYHDVADKRTQANYGVMSEAVLETLVQKALEYGDSYAGFAFQGGEPTLAGLDFYQKLLGFQKKHNRKNLKITNAIQTNGTLIDEAWAEFLAKNRFLVGLSLDGPKDIHDLNRVDADGKGSFNRILKTIQLFEKHRVEYNILCVVTKLVARHVEKVYYFFAKQGFQYLQFIPCLDGLNEQPGQNPFSLTPEIYTGFLKRLFDLWYHDFENGRRLSIRMFDNILQVLLGYPPESCDMKGSCSVNIVIEADGSVFPCDFYVLDRWKLGTIMADGFQSMLQGGIAKDFVGVSHELNKQCRNCEVFTLCRGGCRRNYEPIPPSAPGKNYFCAAYREFYHYALPRFTDIARSL